MTVAASSPPPWPRAELIASLTAAPTPAELTALPALFPTGVDWVEVRADLVGELAADALAGLRQVTRRGLIYTYRSRLEGGRGADEPAARRSHFAAAAGRFERVDLEAERDLQADLLALWPAERRILSWHGAWNGPALGVGDLAAVFAAMTREPAALYKLVPAPGNPGEEAAPLFLLQDLGRDDVLAFASGLTGVWTRLLAPRLGAKVLYGAWPGGTPAAPGQPSVDRLITDFGLPELPPVERLFGIIGNPVAHSLSPRLHNRAYRELGIPALYLPFHADHFADFWLEVVEEGLPEQLGFPLGGFSVTAPFKEVALAIAGASSPRASSIGAANTLVRFDGVWEAESTDPEGVVQPLRAAGVELRGTAALVVGTGGAGRSAALGLTSAGARVTLANRDPERGRQVAEALHLPFVALAELDPRPFRVVVQATSLGRAAADPLPFDPAALAPDAVVVDLVYREQPTPLLAAVIASGRRGIDGREVLLYQAVEQFRRMTGRELPLAAARSALGLGEPAP